MPVPVAPRAPRAPRALGLGLRSGPARPALPGARGAAPDRRRRGPPPAPYFGGYGYGYGGGGGGLGTVVALGVLIAVGQRLLRGGGGGPLLGELGGDAVGVAKVQVGLLGSARDLQRDLDRIATRADTNSADGLHYVLEETVLALLRAPEYWVYGHAETNNERGPRNAEAKFNEYEMEARGKFQEETLVNFGGRTKRSGGGGPADAANEFIVVTVLVAVDGALKLPKVQGRAEVETCLKRLGAVATDRVQAVEVLWSPQEASDTLTQEEIISDYPDLVVL